MRFAAVLALVFAAAALRIRQDDAAPTGEKPAKPEGTEMTGEKPEAAEGSEEKSGKKKGGKKCKKSAAAEEEATA